MTEWAAKVSPLRVVAPSSPEAAAGGRSLINMTTPPTPRRFRRRLTGLKGARGGAIASDEGVRAAMRAGLEFIVAEPLLPPLLAAARAATEDQALAEVDDK